MMATVTAEKPETRAAKMPESVAKSKPEQQSAEENPLSTMLMGLAFGSIVVSLGLFVTRRNESAIFVGLWAPTFLGLSILQKIK